LHPEKPELLERNEWHTIYLFEIYQTSLQGKKNQQRNRVQYWFLALSSKALKTVITWQVF